MGFTQAYFVDKETERLQAKKNQVDDAISSQKRLSQLNDSYRKRYAKYIELFVVLIFSFIAYLGINMIQQNFTQIPSVVFDVIFLIILVLVAYYLYFAAIELLTRSELNYDELYLPPLSDPSGVDVYTLNSLKNAGALSQTTTAGANCVGAACCNPNGIAVTTANPGGTKTVWDPIALICKPSSESFTTLEQAFHTQSLTNQTRSAGSTEIAAEDPTSLSYGIV